MEQRVEQIINRGEELQRQIPKSASKAEAELPSLIAPSPDPILEDEDEEEEEEGGGQQDPELPLAIALLGELPLIPGPWNHSTAAPSNATWARLLRPGPPPRVLATPHEPRP